MFLPVFAVVTYRVWASWGECRKRLSKEEGEKRKGRPKLTTIYGSQICGKQQVTRKKRQRQWQLWQALGRCVFMEAKIDGI
jgi:hypothetical protein